MLVKNKMIKDVITIHVNSPVLETGDETPSWCVRADQAG